MSGSEDWSEGGMREWREEWSEDWSEGGGE